VRSIKPTAGYQEDMDPEEFASLLNLYDTSFRNISEGEVVKGTVLKVTASEVVVDVGYKSEGIIQVNEFLDANGQVTVQPGDTVDVLLERTEDKDGYVVLSREKAEKMKIWDEIEKAYADRKVVIGRVIERINRSRQQVWLWMARKAPGVSAESLQRSWRKHHLERVVCGGWVEVEPETWRQKACE